MFFAIDLLCKQHGGKFSLAWLCATRGISYAKKNDIQSCDISKLCDDIFTMVANQSGRPRLRLSLSLSSRLINGTVKIYRQQVIILEDDIVLFITEVRRPIFSNSFHLLSQDTVDSDQPLIPKVKRTRKPRLVLSQEVAIPVIVTNKIPDVNIDFAEVERSIGAARTSVDPNLITLREDVPICSRDLEAIWDNIQDFGLLEDCEPPPFPDNLPQNVELLQVPHEMFSTPLKRKSTEEPQIILPKRMSIMPRPSLEVIQEESPIVTEAPPVPIVEQPRRESVHEEHRQEEILDLSRTVVKIDTAKRNKTIARTLIKVQQSRVVNINRCHSCELNFFDIWRYQNYVPIDLVKPKIHDYIMELLAPFEDRSENFEERISNIRASPRSRTSLMKSYTPTRLPQFLTPVPSATETLLLPQQITADIHVSAATELQQIPEIPERIEVEVPEILQPIVEAVQISMPPLCPEPEMQISAILPVNVTTETVAAPPAARVIEYERKKENIRTVVESYEKVVKDRQKYIRDIIKIWDPEAQGPLLLENLCKPPINRLNVARTFYDLLCLQKQGNVKLNNKPDSLELGTIEKEDRIEIKRRWGGVPSKT